VLADPRARRVARIAPGRGAITIYRLREAKYDHPRCLHERDAAQQLVKFMSSPEAAPLIRKSGMEPPPP